MAGVPCFNDANCSGTLVCFEEPSWAPPGSPKRFCDCESWYGSTGESCQILGTGAIVQVIWLGLMLVYNLSGFYAATVISRSFLTLPRDRRAMYVIVSSLSLVLSFSFLVGALHRCFELAINLTPEALDSLKTSPGGVWKVHQLLEPQRTFQSIWISFTALGCVNLPLSWIEELMWLPEVDSYRVLIEMHGFEIAILVLDVAVIVVTTTFQPGDDSLLLSICILPVVFAGGWIYYRLPRRLVLIAAKNEEQLDSALLRLTRVLRRTRALVLFGMLFIVVGSGSIALTISAYRGFDKPGDLSLGWISYTVLMTGLELLLFSILYYAWQTKKCSENSRTDLGGNQIQTDLSDATS